MKFGVLDYSYAGFDHFASELRRTGSYTVNLGDYAQTIASRHIYDRLGVAADRVTTIDRDSIPSYRGEDAVLLMNAVFHENSLPAPKAILPIFVGFSASEATIAAQRDWLQRYEPIGCRDPHTAKLLRARGIEATTTGCVTLTLPRRQNEPSEPTLFVVHGSGAGALPVGILGRIPRALASRVELMFHRAPVSVHPVPPEQRHGLEAYERDLLHQLRDRATLVLTPLHHVAAPCIAMGIPVIVCRNDRDPRFGLLEQLLPVHTPASFRNIDWDPELIELDAIRQGILAEVHERLSAVRGTTGTLRPP